MKDAISQIPSPAVPVFPVPSVNNVSVQVAAFNPPRIGLYVYNPSLTVTLWIAPLGTPAVVGGSGSISVEPRQGKNFGPPDSPAWTNGMNAIADTPGANAITILEYKT